MIGRLRTPRLARLVLLACALVVAAGLLSPTLVQGELQVVCLGNGGMKLVAISDDGQGETLSGPSMACPLCQAVAPPPVVVAPPPPLLSLLALASRPAVVARLVALAGAPMPARGPPQA